jgi:hypothetical protein
MGHNNVESDGLSVDVEFSTGDTHEPDHDVSVHVRPPTAFRKRGAPADPARRHSFLAEYPPGYVLHLSPPA